jgi:hypothetical protein
MTEIKSENAEPFFMTLVERIDGRDVPLMSTEDPGIKAFREGLKRIASEIMTPKGDFILEFSDEDEPASSPASDTKAYTRKHKVMGALIGNAPEASKNPIDRERKTLVAVKADLLALQGQCRNFSNVMDVLLSRWNFDCLKQVNDRVIASIVMLLIDADDPHAANAVQNKLGAILEEIDENTDFVEEMELPEKDAGGQPATVIPYKKPVRVSRFRY